MKHPTRKTYLFVFGWLGFLTLLELGVVAAGIPRLALVIFLLGTAAAKALLIALFFMELKTESRLVWLLPLVPVLLGAIFMAALFPDIVFHSTLKM